MIDDSTLENFLDSYVKRTVLKVRSFLKRGEAFNYLNNIIDEFDYLDNDRLHKWVNFMLDEYSDKRKVESDERAKADALYATTMQILVEHYVNNY